MVWTEDLRLEINLEFSLIAVYRVRRGIVFSFIFMHKEGVHRGQRHEVSKPQEDILKKKKKASEAKRKRVRVKERKKSGRDS